MKEFSHINIGEKISFIIGCKNYLIFVVSKKTDKHCANCTRTVQFAQVLKQGGQFCLLGTYMYLLSIDNFFMNNMLDVNIYI